MAKEKLFTPEDFDKPKDKSFWQKYKGGIICIAVVLIIAAIVLCCIFCGKTEDKEVIEQRQTEQVTMGTEAHVNNEGADAVVTVETQEAQEVQRIEEHAAQTSVVEAPKEDHNSEVTTDKPSPQPEKVSDNVEQEAMNVIRGDYGNIPERRERLGSKYQEIQNRVNELKLERVF